MLGHESVTTTERYAELADDILGEAARATAIGRQSVAAAQDALKKSPVIPRSAPDTDRTYDLRFRKPPSSLEESRSYVTSDQLATDTLRAIAAGDPRALQIAVDLAVSVLDSTAAERKRGAS